MLFMVLNFVNLVFFFREVFLEDKINRQHQPPNLLNWEEEKKPFKNFHVQCTGSFCHEIFSSQLHECIRIFIASNIRLGSLKLITMSFWGLWFIFYGFFKSWKNSAQLTNFGVYDSIFMGSLKVGKTQLN